MVNRPLQSRRSLIEKRLRRARGIVDHGLNTDDVMELTRGEKVSSSGRSQSGGDAGDATNPGEQRA